MIRWWISTKMSQSETTPHTTRTLLVSYKSWPINMLNVIYFHNFPQFLNESLDYMGLKNQVIISKKNS